MISILFFILLFLAMLLFFYIGNKISCWQREKFPEETRIHSKIIEASIFALMGLLIAFTFSGSHERFEARRTLVIDEANAIETAYLRLNLLPINVRTTLQNEMKEYVDVRVAIYQQLPFIREAMPGLIQSEKLKLEIWNTAVNACEVSKSSSACIVLLPALNKMMEIANQRTILTQIHPPFLIIIMLVGLALLSAILLGHGMKKRKIMHSLDVFIYIIIISFIIFAIIDLEYPRIGLIPADYFGKTLVQLHQSLQGNIPLSHI